MQTASLAGSTSIIVSSSCPRCGTVGGYAARPCPICYSPAVVLFKDGVLTDATGKLFPVPAQIRVIMRGGRRVRTPKRARAVAALRMVTRWTWRSLCFAAAAHLGMVAIFLLVQSRMTAEPTRDVLTVSHDLKADVSAPVDAIKAPSKMPGEELVHDTEIAPLQPLDESLAEVGDPLYEQPPEPMNFAPLPNIAPPEQAPPQFEFRLRPKAATGLGSGQPAPAPKPVPSGGGLFENRRGETRAAAVQRFGGDTKTENAVELALAFLARTQSIDGSWDPTGHGERSFKDGAMSEDMREPVSALCILPFLAAGNTPEDGKYAVNVKRGLGRLIRMQASDGFFGLFNYQQMYTHGVATLAMCEAYGMTQDKLYLRSAERAVRYIERTQSNKGGWTYMAGLTTPANAGSPLRNDASVTGWMVLALKAAKASGIRVSDRVWTALAGFYDHMSLPTGETYYADDDPYAWRKGDGMVGVGLTSRVVLDRDRFEDCNLAAQKLLLENTPDYERLKDPSFGSTKPNFTTFYGWYYSTIGLFLQSGGEGPGWTRWNEALKSALLENQVTDSRSKERGSWSPDDSWIGPMIGRLYSTACACLCLEVYYRYTPTFRGDHAPAPRPLGEKPAVETQGVADPPAQKAMEAGGEQLDLAKSVDRSKYLRIITKEKGMGAQPTLVDHLRDDSSTVRTTALNMLASLKSPDACKDVMAMLIRDENRALRSSITYTLGELGNKDAVNTLIALLDDGDKMVADQARRSLVALAGGVDLGKNPQSWRAHFNK